MTGLRGEIQAKRRQTSDPRCSFVPEGALDDVITTENIRLTLRDSNAPRDREVECIRWIEQGGKKTFAILVLIQRARNIVKFIEREQLQSDSLDSKLPYGSKADVEKFLLKSDAEDFFERQWEFVSPIFRHKACHRSLHGRTILPFLETKILGGGSFGTIYLETLHRNHSPFDVLDPKIQEHTVVRKELRVTNPDDPDNYQRECHTLSFLNCLKHPNLVELIGSYTLKGIHNLIFPVADYDLDKLLRGKKHSGFALESDYLFALCGLASAIDKFHNYSCTELDISLLGCHHDLRPHNILVHGQQFLLADFGLSNLKTVAEGSKTTWKDGDSRYLAPECEDWNESFKPGEVGRKSDIWSFGCVLSEVITYMMLGPLGVKEFEQFRKVSPDKSNKNWTFYSFHSGTKPNKNLETWLATLSLTATTACKNIINLVRRMLSVDPVDRPHANEVAHCLRFWTIESNFAHVDIALADHRQLHKHGLDMLVEIERLRLWGQIVGLKGQNGQNFGRNSFMTVDNSFHETFQNLKDIERKVTIPDDLHAIAIKLRMINDELMQVLPEALQSSLNSSLEQKLLDTDDLDLLNLIKKTFDQASQHRSIGTLAAVRYMNQLCEAPTSGHGRRMQLKEATFKLQETNKLFAIEEIGVEGQYPKQGLVERIEYEEFWLKELGEELFDRIGSVLELLRTATRSDRELRLLSPIGWFHDLRDHSFKLIFNAPISTEASEDDPRRIKTLKQYIEENTDKQRPALDDRFLLARQLAATLSRLHKTKWVHKNISAFSVIFSLPPGDPPHRRIPPPYLIGFNYSRPSDPEWWSRLPGYDTAVLDYCHPEYSAQKTRVRFQSKFDWYSLGLVMLEIGHWRTLGSMTKGKKTRGFSPQELLEYIQSKYVPSLDFYMGRNYRHVVERCLDGDIGPQIPASEDYRADFEQFDYMQTVEEQLASCALQTD